MFGRLIRTDRGWRSAILAITLLAFALRCVSLVSQSLWRDEVDALIFATRPLPQLLEMFRQPGQNGPLFFLLLRPWLALAGHSEFALRFPAVLFGVLAVPVVAILIARLAGRRVALLGALLLATAPYGVWYGQEAKMYSLLTALAPASLLAIVWLRQRQGWRPWVVLYLLTTLGVYAHLLAVLIVPVQMLWLAFLPWSTRWWRRILAVPGYLLALALPYVPFLRWAPQMWTSDYQTGHPFVPLDDIIQVLGGAFSTGVLGTEPMSLLPYMLALVAGVLLWPRLAPRAGNRVSHARPSLRGPEWLWRTENASGARWRSVALLVLWMVLPPLLIYIVSLGMPVFTDRYVIWAMPAYLALLACGIVALTTVWRPLGMVIGALVLALNGWSVYLQASQSIKADFRAAAAYVLARQEPDDAIMYQIPYNRYTFSYYVSRRNAPEDPAWAGKEGPYTNYGMSPAEADAWMAAQLGAANVVWLVSSETAMWDERNLTEQWFAANATVTDRGEFNRVTVTRYER